MPKSLIKMLRKEDVTFPAVQSTWFDSSLNLIPSKSLSRISFYAVRILTLGALFVALRSHAATILARSPSRVDVGTAVASAVDGDIVSIPPGTASWTNTLVISNAITLKGAGIGQTILVDEIIAPKQSSDEPLLYIGTSMPKSYRITGIEFTKGAQNISFDFGAIWFSGTSRAVRVDNCKFHNLRNIGIYWGNAVCGVVDHCTFDLVNRHAFQVWHYSWPPAGNGQPWGDGSWAVPFDWGTANMVVAEDCIFTKNNHTAATDAFAGARYCIRYSTFTNCYIEVHGTETTARYRGGRGLEVYMNKFYDNSSWPSPVDIRSGSAVVWSNKINGYSWAVTLGDQRMLAPMTPWGQANGTNAWDLNISGVAISGTHKGAAVALQLIDTNASWTVNQWKGYVINNPSTKKAAVCTSNSATVAVFKSAAGSGYPPDMSFSDGQTYEFRKVDAVLDGCGRGSGDLLAGNPPTPVKWPNQAVEPIYAWGNSVPGGQNRIANGGYGPIVPGREFMDETVKPGYTPLVYPHPLVTGTLLVGDQLPPPPNRLRLK